MKYSIGRRRLVGVALSGALLLGLAPGVDPAWAENPAVPDSCKTHPTKVVNPGCAPAVSEQVDGAVADALAHETTYPNLVPNVTEVRIYRPLRWNPETQTVFEGPPMLTFDTHSQNFGTVPVDLLADDPENITASTVSQCVSWAPDYVCRERHRVGGFSWHAEHTHFHYQDFASYGLRRLGPDGRPDYSSAGLVGASEKVSFCLMDSTPVADDAVPVPTYAACNPIRQGISPGWADIYTSDLPGQEISIDGLADGSYALVVTMDPADHLFESDDTDNRIEVTVAISGGLRNAEITDRHLG